VERFAQLLVDRPEAVFIWSMDLTQHANGVDTVKALLNVGLARGLAGRPNRGMVPIRGHSGVQGGSEVGCSPYVSEATAARWSRVWEFPVQAGHGWSATEMIDHAAAGDVDVFWLVGGNFLETVGDVALASRALARPRLRIHHDIVLSSSMLVPGDGDVLVLPATTRYESPGGGTETSTERRIIFSPEVAGRRIGHARSEWQVFGDALARMQPNRANYVRFRSAAEIREEIGQAIPLYQGIESLSARGDQVQWGGRILYQDGRFATADGKAHFAAITVRDRANSVSSGAQMFRVSTRRGKQFNAMVQRDVDPLTGAGRDAVLISAADLRRLNLRDGDRIRLTSADGAYEGRAFEAGIAPGNLEVHWPEGNVLLSAAAVDPESREPDYNASVTVEKVS
jgi:predicted molibdopterin-dependent oxidoreductase YjgC